MVRRTLRGRLFLGGLSGLAALVAGVLPACEDRPETTAPLVVVTPAEFGKPWDKLSEWHLFEDASTQTPADRVVPYQVASPLFSDYATKFRFMYVPKVKTIGYRDDGAWDFPEGTILVKTFAYPKDVAKPYDDLRLMETRLLWRQPGTSCPDAGLPQCWTAHTYVYDEDGKDATSVIAGKFIHVDFVGPEGISIANEYHVPNTVECKECHQVTDEQLPLGPKTRQLERDVEIDGETVDQIDHLFELGLFDRQPTPKADRPRLVDPSDTSLPVEDRMRSYFDANCGHCHSQGGFASDSALWLDFDSTGPEVVDRDRNLGICKNPLSAGEGCGNVFDVVPGEPDQSIMVCRLGSTEIDVRMPPLGSKVVHVEGLALVREWIESLPGAACL
jgi:uncharacterized repeat protein (TIGR03806 family)